MNIHILWYLCLLIRITLIYFIKYIYNNHNKYIFIIQIILLSIGLGFMYKGYFGSNNEIQIDKVFWHNARYIHGFFYLLAVYYLSIDKLDVFTYLLKADIIFSIAYRLIFNK